MTTYVPLAETPQIVASRLEESYAGSRPYQWAVELWRNYAQVIDRTPKAELRGDERQKFDMIQLHGGALKRVVWNSAQYLPLDDLSEYFTQVGAGHGDTWRLDNPTGNRHAGAREMLLPWNPAGVVVISYHPTDLPEGAMVWMMRDSETNGYVVKMLPTGTVDFSGQMAYKTVAPLEVDEYGFDWASILTDEILEHGGVMFALLGTDLFADDIAGVDPGTSSRPAEVATGVAGALIDRVAEIRGKVTVVYQVNKGSLNRTDSSGRNVDYDSRHVYGADGWVQSGQKREVVNHQTGVWSSPDGLFSVEWTLLDEAVKASSLRPFTGLGHVVAKYRDEFMDIPPSSQRRRLSLWGVSYAAVADRLSLRVHPKTSGPGYHVIQGGASRSTLRGSDGRDVPWEEWADEFSDDLPTAIAEALANVRLEQRSHTEAIEKLLKRINTRLAGAKQSAAQVTTAGGPLDRGVAAGEPVTVSRGGEGEGGGTGGKGGSDAGSALGASGRGNHKPVVRRRLQSPPTPVWMDGDEWNTNAAGILNGESDDVFIYYSKGTNELWFNKNHTLYTEQVSHYLKWAKSKSRHTAKLSGADIVDVIQQAYELDTTGRVFAALKHYKDRFTRAIENDLLLLTFGSDGYQNVDGQILTSIGGLASAVATGKAKRTAA